MRARFPLLWLSLVRRRRMLLSLAVALCAFELLIGAIIRAVPADVMIPGGAEPPQAFQAFSGSSGSVPLTSLAGLLGAGLVHPLWIGLHLTAVAALAAAVLAADVESGTVELVAVRPVSRQRVLAERVAALVAGTTFLQLAAFAGVLLGLLVAPALREEVGMAGAAAAMVHGWALLLAIAGLAVAVSAAGRSKGQVIAATVVVGAGGFALNFAALAWSAASWVRWASPFNYYLPADVLVRGAIDWTDLSVLLAVVAAGYAAAAAAIEGRDLAV